MKHKKYVRTKLTPSIQQNGRPLLLNTQLVLLFISHMVVFGSSSHHKKPQPATKLLTDAWDVGNGEWSITYTQYMYIFRYHIIIAILIYIYIYMTYWTIIVPLNIYIYICNIWHKYLYLTITITIIPFPHSPIVCSSQVWRARLCALLFLLIGLAFQSPLLPCSRA